MSKRDVVEELHRPCRRNFKRRKVIIKGLDDLWQADLVEMGVYASENNGYRYLLTVIDTFSKYGWVVPLKNKTALAVANAMQSIFDKKRIPKNLQTDDGKEFFNNTHFPKLMAKHQINHYSTYSALKASIVERFNRTLKSIMWKEFSSRGAYKWIHLIKELLLDYNSRKHRTIKMRPLDVNKSNEQQLLSTVYERIKIKPVNTKFKYGDCVRISKYKHVFSKGYTPNWTTEIFKVKTIQPTSPVTYLLEDYQGNPIRGGFYEQELTLTKYPKLFLVEKILQQRRNNNIFVKWLGFNNEHNTWIKKSELIE